VPIFQRGCSESTGFIRFTNAIPQQTSVRIFPSFFAQEHIGKCAPLYNDCHQSFRGSFHYASACCSSQAIGSVTGHLSEGSFVRNVVLQIPKFEAKPNPKPNTQLDTGEQNRTDANPILSPNPSPNPVLIRFGQMTFGQVNCYPLDLVIVHLMRRDRNTSSEEA